MKPGKNSNSIANQKQIGSGESPQRQSESHPARQRRNCEVSAAIILSNRICEQHSQCRSRFVQKSFFFVSISLFRLCAKRAIWEQCRMVIETLTRLTLERRPRPTIRPTRRMLSGKSGSITQGPSAPCRDLSETIRSDR